MNKNIQECLNTADRCLAIIREINAACAEEMRQREKIKRDVMIMLGVIKISPEMLANNF